MMLTLARGIGQGRRIALLNVFGMVFVAGMVQVSMLVLGLATLLHSYPLALDVLRWVGAAYLVWLGIKMLKVSRQRSDAVLKPRMMTGWQAVKEGAINSLTNPKSLLFMFAFLPQFGALSMVTVRIGAILAPALGGIIIVFGGVGLAFAVAAAGTLGTLVPLVRLPTLLPQQQEPEHPLRALASGFQFVWRNKVVGSVVLLGMLMSIVGAVRVLFPALAQDAYHVGASSIGLMYSAVPLGAMLGALTSGWVGRYARPGVLILVAAIVAFTAIASLGLFSHLAPALLALVCYGYANAIASLLQFMLIQSNTPDHLLGRVNSLGTAQDVTGDSIGALGLGVLGRVFTPLMSVLSFGAFAAVLGVLVAFSVRTLRQCRPADALVEHDDPAPATSAAADN